MKRALISFALLAALVGTMGLTQPRPRYHSKTYSVLPGATLNLENRTFHEVEIRSEYPIQIAAGPCHADSTVQWHCSFQEPADLFLRDLRHPPVFMTPRANAITVTMSED